MQSPASNGGDHAPTAPPAAETRSRLASIDAYRGLVMLLMMGEVLEFGKVSEALPKSAFWAFLALHQSHVEWVGCTLHDLIQPSFSFLVGVALPFSLARRAAEGQTDRQRTLHAFQRALALILLGVFLRAAWTFEDTLSQIGLGYGFLYLLAQRPVRWQWVSLAAILVGYWLFFALYPLPQANFDYAKAGVTPQEAHQLTGFAAHWNKNTNPAWAFDTWFLNLFPRERPFTHNGGGYSTLSFIPTLGTMILGLIAGGVLRSGRNPAARIRWLVAVGGLCLLAGWLLNVTGICPVVKRIWTPGWVLFSGGWCLLFLAGFYAVLDVWPRRAWAFPLLVVGMNSIAAYLIAHLLVGAIGQALNGLIGEARFAVFGEPYKPMLHGAGILLAEWLLLWWMSRRKIFFRL